VTALLVKRLFGGEVMRGKVNGETHYWNRIKGVEIDFTSDQYDGGDGFTPVTTGKPVKRLNWNLRRFKILWEKI